MDILGFGETSHLGVEKSRCGRAINDAQRLAIKAAKGPPLGLNKYIRPKWGSGTFQSCPPSERWSRYAVSDGSDVFPETQSEIEHLKAQITQSELIVAASEKM